MSLDADLIVDRRRMRRKLTFWRVADGAGRHRRRGRRAASCSPAGTAISGGAAASIARVTITA